MVTVLSLLIALTVLGLAAIQNSETEMSIAHNSLTNIASFYIAEAGSERAFAVLRDSTNWRAGFPATGLSDGQYSVTVVDSTSNAALADTILILSTGRRLEATSTVELKALPGLTFEWATFADSSLKLCGNATTDSYDSDMGSYATTASGTGGDVASNGYVKTCGTAHVGGDVSTSAPGMLDIGSGTVSGDTSSTVAPVSLPEIPQSLVDKAYDENAAPDGFAGGYFYPALTHDLTVSSGQIVTLSSGVYHVNDLSIKGTVLLSPGAKVQIVVTGTMDLLGPGNINPNGLPADLIFYGTGGDITISSSSEIRAGIYAPTASVKLAGGTDYYGAIMCRDLDDVGGASYHFDQALTRTPVTQKVRRVSWRTL
jgi:hypothetical protein